MNILISSVGRRTYLIDYFQESLAGIGKVFVSNSIENSTGVLRTNNSFIVPSSLHKDYIDSLMGECIDRKISYILPQHDIDVLSISMHKKNFLDKNIFPIVPEIDKTLICLDKFAAFKFLRELGIPSLRTYLDLQLFLNDLKKNLVDFPIILKPRFGYGSRNLIKVDTLDELLNAYQFLNLMLRREDLPSIFESEDSKIIIQEYIYGEEYGADIVNDLKGKYVGCYVKRKIAMRSGETEIAKTVEIPFFDQYAKTISSNISHPGNMDIDFIVTKCQRVFILDLNPRIGGGYPFTHAAGVDLPKLMISWAQNKQILKNDLKMQIGLTLSKSYVISRH